MIMPFIALISCLLVFFANAVILLNHPIKSVLCLAACCLCVSVLWLVFGAEYLALVLIFLYVGAVMTLFLFMVMMMNVSEYDPDDRFSIPFALFVVAVTVITPCCLFGLVQLIGNAGLDLENSFIKHLLVIDRDFMSFAHKLYDHYFWVLQIVALILAVPVVLAAGIVRQGANPKAKHQNSSEQLQVKASERLSMIHSKQARR